ncbi:DUF262 domain-containing protein [Pedobacter jeongneungensis]|uniref:DUF262 domain-containing protein n=1 Tax=Pedobacter jeongneungensis TaxID=947309 RepID=UPI0021CF43E6|nr:DUF262 domain-containing protein [Pedobacter jeongneungensis]
MSKLNRGDIYIPDFQRNYIWNQAEASKLIESLLLGLPVPGIFLAQEDSNKLLVIDGQQRLKSLQFFINGYFDPKDGVKPKVFKLTKVQTKFNGLAYPDLEESDRRLIQDSIIHSTIIKQESPSNDNTAIYHVFERLNSSGRKLTPQEIRTAVYNGTFSEMVVRLNEDKNWRQLFGSVSARLKDQELILRFLAVRFSAEKYFRPMSEFLNKFNIKNRNIDNVKIQEYEIEFLALVKFLNNCIGPKVFRPEGVFNVSVYESIMVGLSKIKTSKGLPECKDFVKNYARLIEDEKYKQSISRATSDESVFQTRQALTAKFLDR